MICKMSQLEGQDPWQSSSSGITLKEELYHKGVISARKGYRQEPAFSPGAPRLLLVEDEAIIALATKRELEQEGYLIETAHSGEEAWKVFQEAPDRFSLILMDIDLGRGMDGTETAAKILAERELPVIFLSSHTEPEVVAKTDKITSYGYIVKNSGSTILYTAIKMAFRLFEAKSREQQKEERFNRVLQAIPDMVSIHDEEMNILYSNWNGFGAVPEEKRQTGTKCYITYRGFNRICPDCQAKRVLDSQQPFHAEAQLPDGTWVDLRVLPIEDPREEKRIFVEWVRDITERKKTEEALKESESRYSRAVTGTRDGLWDSGGTPLRITGFNTDITDLKKTEEHLHQVLEEKEELLRRLKEFSEE